MDGRKNNGGHKTAGRKPKSDEVKLIEALDKHIDQEEVFEYFMEAESDDIEDALEEFEGAYTEEEMRLLRIKFMSDVAN